uniref:ZP domain-containing protein n=1 Tax=Meloidogyne javanica TaxID=6303 RepID=A0A915N4A2_MELJA
MFIKTLFIFTYSFIASLASPYGGDNNYYYPTAQQSNNYSPSPSTPFLSTPDIIDNEVVEAPLIHCTDRGVEFSIKTKNTFRGNIYVQGQFGLTECRREFYNNDAPQAGIEVRLNDCGMIRERRPHGMSYSIVLIVNFHPRFVTRVDRAFKILCSYQHTERPPPNCPNSVNYPPPHTPYPASQYPYGQQQQPLLPQNPPQGEAYANFMNNPTSGSTPSYSLPTYIGAGISPTWPPNALPLGSVLQGNPSQVLQENARRSARRFFNPVPAEAIEQDELRLRQRRAEEKTQDVVAVSTVTNDGLQGMDWSFENGKERIQQRRTMPTYTMKADKTFSLEKNTNESLNSSKNTTQQHQLPSQLAQNYCLNRSTLAALVGTIGLLSTILLAISCCLLWDFLSSRQRCRKGLINWRDSSNKLGNGKNGDPREALAQILNRNHNKLDK